MTVILGPRSLYPAGNLTPFLLVFSSIFFREMAILFFVKHDLDPHHHPLLLLDITLPQSSQWECALIGKKFGYIKIHQSFCLKLNMFILGGLARTIPNPTILTYLLAIKILQFTWQVLSKTIRDIPSNNTGKTCLMKTNKNYHIPK